MPLLLDLTQRIINVQWSVATFIAADNAGNIFAFSKETTDPDTGLPAWKKVKTCLDSSGNNYFHIGSAHGWVGEDDQDKTSTFVVVSYTTGTVIEGAIWASRDGRSWSKAFTLAQEQPDRNRSATLFGVTWDGSQFWAGAHQSLDRTAADWEFGDPRLLEIDILLKSSDGFSWNEAGRHETVWIDVSDPDYTTPDYTRGLLAEHCSDKVKDASGNGLPDGFYGYDPDKELLITPKDPQGLPTVDYFFGGIGYGSPSGVTVTQADDDETSIDPNPGVPTICVARSGNSWIAAGGDNIKTMAAILVPDPDAESEFIWKRIDPPPGPGSIVTIVGVSELPPTG